MKRLLWNVSLLNLGIAGSFACCAEEDYSQFTVGEQNVQTLMIEFDLYRNCDMGEDPENLEFFTRGTVRLDPQELKSTSREVPSASQATTSSL